ncbi:hypothetical protein HYS91_04480 [Candidatus Daviesbacteria bacterium]|nr:hypothetical protein [Candidatus Daviesbacteria bacterium]
MKFKSRNPKYEHLRKKWTQDNKNLAENLFDKHLRHMAIGSLGGLMLLNTSGLSLAPFSPMSSDQFKVTGEENKNLILAAKLKDKIPNEIRSLTPLEEDEITQILSQDFGFKVASELNGKRLNRYYGLIGGEQHLYRYPGDTIYAHAKTAQDWAMYGSSGIAPGLGAWGYFAPSKEEFTSLDEQKERYYLAIQTFLASGFAERVGEYRDFFKFRKMLVVNPNTGQAVVAVIGDAGPAEWTGKHLGGSPEVMHEVGLAGGPRKGAVLYFFIDDPTDSIPLGPVKVKET